MWLNRQVPKFPNSIISALAANKKRWLKVLEDFSILKEYILKTLLNLSEKSKKTRTKIYILT